jgi:D-glycero-alpha-D-manno-heptose 1-phosphate guanylyltransferase
MAIKEAIILAGGLGTRLRDAVPDLPKCLAPVAGKPFLEYIIRHFQQQGIKRFIFAVGYKRDMIAGYLKSLHKSIEWELSIEQEPLGTGGAIQLACDKITGSAALILNGDSFFGIDLPALESFHKANQADCSLSLKQMKDFDRYGVVSIDQENAVTSFQEKKHYSNGLINAGVYALEIDSLLKASLPDVFSFEKDYLEIYHKRQRIFGLEQDRYFIDIGIPSDYEKAQRDWKQLINE